MCACINSFLLLLPDLTSTTLTTGMPRTTNIARQTMTDLTNIITSQSTAGLTTDIRPDQAANYYGKMGTNHSGC